MSALISNRKKTLNIVFPTGLVLAATKDATVPVQGPEGTLEKENRSLAGPAPDRTSQSLARAPRSPAPARLSASPAQRAAQTQSRSAVPAADLRRRAVTRSRTADRRPRYRTGRKNALPNLPHAHHLPMKPIAGPSRGISAPCHDHGLAHDLDRPLGISGVSGRLWG